MFFKFSDVADLRQLGTKCSNFRFPNKCFTLKEAKSLEKSWMIHQGSGCASFLKIQL